MTDTHDFLLTEGAVDAVEAAAQAQQAVNSLPETCAVFSPNDYLPMSILQPEVSKHILALTGAWKLPNRFVASSTKKYVNPHHPHAYKYSDVYTDCAGCGNYVSHINTVGNNYSITDADEHHKDHCPRYEQLRVAGDILETRETVIQKSFYHGVRGPPLSKRLAVKSQNVSSAVRALDISREDLYQEFLDRRRNTIAELSRQGWKTQTIADAYDISAKQVATDVKNATGKSIKKVKA